MPSVLWAIGAGAISLATAAHGANIEIACGMVTDALAVGEVHTYELTAAPGSVVMIAVGEPSGVAGFDPAFTLTDGDGVVLASCAGGNGCNATGTLTGPSPHTVKVFDVGSDAANTYNLSIVPLSDAFSGAPSCAVTLGCDATAPIAASLARGAIHSYLLAAAPGSVVMVAIGEPLSFGSFDPTFMLTDGNGAVLATCSSPTACNQKATLSGPPPYMLTVFDVGSDVANGYNLSVKPLSDAFGAEAGCTVAVGCDAPTPLTAALEIGQIDSYRIAAQQGGVLMIGVGEASLKGGFNPTFTFTDADGTELASCSAASGCNDVATLSGPAPYTVTVFDEGSDSAHSYNLSVVPLSDAFAGTTACMESIGCDAQIPNGASLGRGEIDSYRLTAESGSVVMVAIAETAPFDGFDPTFTLSDGDGAEIATCSATIGCNQRATLTGPAPYTVTVFDVGSDIAASYNLSVVPLSDAFPSQSACTMPIGCSTLMPVSGALAKGDLASYRLDADPGDVVALELTETPAVFGFNPALALTDGDGAELKSCTGTNGCLAQATLTGPPPFTVTIYDVASDVANGYQLSASNSACTQTTSTTTPPTSTTSLPISTTTTTLAGASGCSLPVTSGPIPKASDCLFILGTAVGSRTCTPECVCDTDASGGISASDALRCLRAAVGQPVTLNCPCASAVVSQGRTSRRAAWSTVAAMIPISRKPS